MGDHSTLKKEENVLKKRKNLGTFGFDSFLSVSTSKSFSGSTAFQFEYCSGKSLVKTWPATEVTIIYA
jgi:hypothetical protein